MPEQNERAGQSQQIQFTRASRASAIPLIAFYGESGSGKTYSALLLARGIAGEKPIVGIDTERGRMSLFADDAKIGGYEVALLEEPYTPSMLVAYIAAAEASGAGCIILDSGSHEWEGVGGVLNTAGENEMKSGKSGLHNWKKPKEEHSLFVAKLMRCRVPIIVCLRAKYKTRSVKGTKEAADAGLIQFNQVGRQCIVKDDFLSPIQAEDFIFEATVHTQINPDHTIVVTKGGPDDLRACFPENNKGWITVEHGRAVARWVAGGGHKVTGPQKPPATADPANPPAASKPVLTPEEQEVANLKVKIWSVGKLKHADVKALQQYLWDEGIISDTEELGKLPASRLTQVLNALNERR